MTKRLAVKLVLQQPGQCGPATLAMVLDYFGVKISLPELVTLTKCQPAEHSAGTAATDLLKAARYFGLTGVVQSKATIDDLRWYVGEQKIPVIVNWFSENDGHYSVVVRITAEHIYLRDPEFSTIRKMTLKNFDKIWFDFDGGFQNPKLRLRVRRFIAIYPPKFKVSQYQPLKSAVAF
jgi:ABC-type bacteriocin/lantibiotic exporter with double-glycine peptidase domain